MRAWLTQDSVPATRKEYVLTLPNDESWRAQFLGAFLNLALEENWEKFGDLTPLDMADEWLELLLLFESQGVELIPVGTIMAYAGSVAPSGFFMCDFSEFNRSDFLELFGVIGTRYGSGNGTTTANLPDLRGRVIVGLNAADADFNGLGDFGGQKSVTLDVSEIPAHTHTQTAHTHTQTAHTHTQTAHTHTQNSHSHILPAHNHTQTGHSHIVDGGINGAAGAVTRGLIVSGSGSNNVNTAVQTPAIQNASPTIAVEQAVNQNTTAVNQNTTAVNQDTTAVNQSVGGGSAHNNLQPYWVMNYIIKY